MFCGGVGGGDENMIVMPRQLTLKNMNIASRQLSCNKILKYIILWADGVVVWKTLGFD